MAQLVELSSEKVIDQTELTKDETEEHYRIPAISHSYHKTVLTSRRLLLALAQQMGVQSLLLGQRF
jgi:hypothetical protein